jgi:hypothetical protein
MIDSSVVYTAFLLAREDKAGLGLGILTVVGWSSFVVGC